ncbi:MAG TPA: alpha/beta hydrolase [Acidimicrobiales bacterium]|nr:alpha/beta hydrolase [Acidimicrobiales bacterium]
MSTPGGWAPAPDADASYALFPKDRKVVADDGTPLAYTILTRDEGPHRARRRVQASDATPVLFANGWSCSDAYWAYLAPHLAASGHPAVIADTRGHGASGLPRAPGRAARGLTWEDLAISRLADDLVGVLADATTGRRPAVVIGHSMGVQIALELYRRHPEQVAALVLVAGPFENPLRTFYGGNLAERLFPFAYLVARAAPELLRPMQALVGIERTSTVGARLIGATGDRVAPADLGPYLRHLATRDPGFLTLLADAMRRHSAADMLESVRAPTLILAAGRDQFCPPRIQSELHERITGSEIVWFDEAGHTLPIEHPDEIAGAVDAFLDTHGL